MSHSSSRDEKDSTAWLLDDADRENNCRAEPIFEAHESCSRRTWHQQKQDSLKYVVLAFSFSLLALVLGSVYIWRANHPLAADRFYLNMTIKHLKNHPTRDSAGNAFADMGFRTKLYANLLNDPSISALQLQDYERSLWFFAPGIKEIRKRANSVNAKGRPTQGIVISAGVPQFKYVCHLLATLRELHKCQLPIEVFYYGDDDLPKHLREHLSLTYNVNTIDIKQVGLFDESAQPDRGFSIKAFSLLATSFSEVLMLDADAVLLTSPDRFFSQPGYRAHGSMFFKDRFSMMKSEDGYNFIKGQLGLQQPSASLANSSFWNHHLLHNQESGLIVVNRSRPSVLAALLFAAWQNSKSIRESVSYKYYYGDKETFWLSFELSELPYYLVSNYGGVLGAEHSEHFGGFCGDHLLHFFDAPPGRNDSIANTAQVHLGAPAWFNGSLRNNRLHGNDAFLNLSDTIWSMDGNWRYYGGSATTWCLTDFTRHTTKELGLHEILSGLVETGKHAESLGSRVEAQIIPNPQSIRRVR